MIGDLTRIDSFAVGIYRADGVLLIAKINANGEAGEVRSKRNWRRCTLRNGGGLGLSRGIRVSFCSHRKSAYQDALAFFAAFSSNLDRHLLATVANLNGGAITTNLVDRLYIAPIFVWIPEAPPLTGSL
ncbi:MAG: hypothetical protein ACI9R3_001970 [Verrucomicrobiales bacterium]|jgi:hypothetical protein